MLPRPADDAERLDAIAARERIRKFYRHAPVIQEDSMDLSTVRVGDLFTVGRACLDNPAGARAVVVELYTLPDRDDKTKYPCLRPGISLLFPNGGFDGFSPRDAELFELSPVGRCEALAGYRFRNVLQLDADFRRGLFAAAWETV